MFDNEIVINYLKKKNILSKIIKLAKKYKHINENLCDCLAFIFTFIKGLKDNENLETFSCTFNIVVTSLLNPDKNILSLTIKILKQISTQFVTNTTSICDLLISNGILENVNLLLTTYGLYLNKKESIDK